MKRLALGLLVVASLTFAPAALASGGAPSGFSGVWTAVDCASWWEDAHLDCDEWGDESTLAMVIGRGAAPPVFFFDSYATICANADLPTRFFGVGKGEYVDIFLFVDLKTWCGRFRLGEAALQLYHDPGSDTLFDDQDGDGWGITWYRVY